MPREHASLFTMRSVVTTLALASSLLSVPANARNLPSGLSAPKVVSLTTERKVVTNPVKRDRIRRRDTVRAELDNEETLYFVNGTVGTPPQAIRMHLDTGSSDLWVNTDGSRLCAQTSRPCAYGGTYNANESSTYGYVGSWFNISYVDGSGASGDYVTDTITIGSSTLTDFQFGVGYRSTSEQGILGIGYAANEVQVGRARLDPYENLPLKMVSSGQIPRNVYSLWLNDLDSSTGSILFGGVDSAHYTGALLTLPVQANGGIFAEFLITLTSLVLGNITITDNRALAVLLDTGSSLTYLPDDVVERIYQEVGAQYDSSAGAAYVPCALEDRTDTLDFDFGGPRIAVEMNELVLDLITASGRRPTFANGVSACLFGIAPAGTGTNVLGDTFLRSAYAVYDLDRNEISIAQTRFNTTESNIQEVPTDGGVPGATPVENPVAATEGLSRGTGNGNAGVGSGTGSGAPGANMAAPAAAILSALAFGAVTLIMM